MQRYATWGGEGEKRAAVRTRSPAPAGMGGAPAEALAPLQARANAGPHAAALAGLQAVVAQRACADCERVRDTMGATAQRAAARGGGLPEGLRAGLESLSGRDLSGVRVHYGSPKPAQLEAHAYTQGSEIHVAAGQERHLPHEGWHAVQQMEGRVRPTLQLHGTAVNDDAALEREADVMGARAMRGARAAQRAANAQRQPPGPGPAVAQRVVVIGEGEPITGEKKIYGMALEAGASEPEAEMLAAMASDRTLHRFGSWEEAVHFVKLKSDPNNNSNEIGGNIFVSNRNFGGEEELGSGGTEEELRVHELGVGGSGSEGVWTVNPDPPPAFVNRATGETYDPEQRTAGSLRNIDQRKLTPFAHWKKMRRIGQDVGPVDSGLDEEAYQAYDGMRRTAGLGDPWAEEVLEKKAEELADRVGVDEAMKLLPDLIGYLKEMTGLLRERTGAFRPTTREFMKRKIEENAGAIAEGKTGTFTPGAFGRTSDQEMIAQQLLNAKKKGNVKRFKGLLANADPVVTQTATGLKLEFNLGGIPLGEVTLVQIAQDTVELHFNVEEPLKYIGVASELWNRGLKILETAFPNLGKMNVILPSYSSASTLMVTRQLAQLGGDAGDYVLGKKAGEERKARRDVESSSSAQHERYVKGGQDESTAQESAHYLRSVAKSVYSHAFGIVGYLNPWSLMEAYGVGAQDVDAQGLAAAIEEQAGNPSTLAGHVEVRRAHQLLGLDYDAEKFVPAVESGKLKMMLGVRGQSLIDFSLERKTWATIKRWGQLKFAE